MPDEYQDLVSIPRTRLKRLVEDSKELAALHAGGVDNWEWYHESLKEAGLLDDEEDEEDDD